MAFSIQITSLALTDIDDAVDFYEREASKAVASKWLDGLVDEVETLQDNPHRCALAPENDDLDFEVRQTHFKLHRVLFTVEGNTVNILRIYHSARKPLTPHDPA